MRQNRQGSITRIEKRQFNLYKQGSNQLIMFHYSTGSLTIKWMYKYLQKEVVHERVFYDVRNLSLIEQDKISKSFVQEMAKVIANHKNDVLRGGL